MSIQFYESFRRYVSVENFEVIPLLLQMRWYGQAVSREMHLIVAHPESVNPRALIVGTRFHKVLWDDVDDSKESPFRMGRLRLEGRKNEEEIYALLTLDLNKKGRSGEIIFSPVPFGPDGKPKLQYSGDKLIRFLQVARVVFGCLDPNAKRSRWNPETLTDSLQKMHGNTFCDSLANYNWLAVLEKLGLVVSDGSDKGFLTDKTRKEVETIFGINLW